MALSSTPTLTLGMALRIEARAAYTSEDLRDVRLVGEQAADGLDEFQRQCAADEATGAYTASGLAERRRMHGEKLAQMGTLLEREADALAKRAGDDLDALMSRLQLAPRDLLEREQ